MTEVRHRFSERTETGISFEGEISRTKQAPAESTNINAIVKRHAKTGVVTHLNHAPPQYGDVSMAMDLQAAMQAVFEAEDAFGRLPAEVRKAAQNDPVRLLEMLADEDDRELLVEAGLEVETEEDPPAEPAEPAETPPEPTAEGEAQ